MRLLEGLLWSMGGLVVGYALCWVVIEAAMRTSEGHHMAHAHGVRLEVIRTFIGVCILLLLLVSSIKYYQSVSCQRDYNAALAEAFNYRSTAQKLESEAQIELLQSVGSPDGSGKRREAISRYIEALQKLEQSRLSHPLPPPPDCGGVL